eukprot:6147117-Pyramimonas_sp.AAC.1
MLSDSWGPLGAVLGVTLGSMGLSLASLGQSSGPLGPSWGTWRASWTTLGRPGMAPEPSKVAR